MELPPSAASGNSGPADPRRELGEVDWFPQKRPDQKHLLRSVPSAKTLLLRHEQQQETVMPVLLVPLLVGIPVVMGGGYLIYKVVGG
jgi:hypothetical protein